MPSPKHSPGVCDSYFELSDTFKLIERVLGSECVLPGQLDGSVPEDVRDARKLAAAILRQALDDLEQAVDRRDRLRPTENPNVLTFEDLDEVTSWIFEDSIQETINIEPNPMPTEEAIFPTPATMQTLTLERDASSDTYSFTGCTKLLGLDAHGIRKILKSWMQARSRGEYLALAATDKDVVARRRLLASEHQLSAMRAAKYPMPALCGAFKVGEATVRKRLRLLEPPTKPRAPRPPRTPREREAIRMRNAQARLWSRQGMPRDAITMILGIDRRNLASVLRCKKLPLAQFSPTA